MKKLIIVLLFVIASTPLFAFNHEPFFHFELGTHILDYERIGFTDISVGYRLEFSIFKNEIYTGMFNYQVWGDHVFSNYPFRIIYTFGNKFYIGKSWYIKVEHLCSHAVKSESNKIEEETPSPAYWYQNTWGDSRTTISLCFEWN